MKNWIVITKPVKKGFKGLSEYTNYLVSKTHPNHRMTEILPVHNNKRRFVSYCAEQVLLRDAEREKNKKGGRPISSYAQSFVFSLPPTLTLDEIQWNNIAKYIFTGLSSFLSIEIKTLKKATFLNIHDQNNQHLNLVVSKVVEGKVLRAIQKKAINEYLKNKFNEAVLLYAKMDNKDYEPLTKRNVRYNQSFFNSNKDIIFDTTMVGLKRAKYEMKKMRFLEQKQIKKNYRRIVI